MPRARNIKPSFFVNEELGELKPCTRLLFIALWCLADREGRLDDRPKRIKTEALPYDEVDIDTALNDLANSGFIARYEVNGSRYIQIMNFKKHQNPHIKEQASRIPAMGTTDLAQDLHNTCTVQTSCRHEECTGVAVLIPDSLNLIPDSLKYSGVCSAGTGGSTGVHCNEHSGLEAAEMPPTLEKVQAYCVDRRNNVNAKRFYDYYNERCWRDGKGNPVLWKQKMSIWEQNSNNKAPPEQKSRFEGMVK